MTDYGSMAVPPLFPPLRVKFCGVGYASGINEVVTLAACPRVDEEVCFGSDDEPDANTWSVRRIVHYVHRDEYDVYCVVGPPRSNY